MNKWAWTKRTKKPKESSTRRTLDEMTKPELEEKLDEAFSEYVRRSAAGGHDWVSCVTCGKLGYWKEMDCGHYVSRVFRATRWDLKNVAVQCPRCNRFLGGVAHEMRAYLVETYGEEVVKEIETRGTLHGERRLTSEWMIEQINAYREKNKLLRAME